MISKDIKDAYNTLWSTWLCNSLRWMNEQKMNTIQCAQMLLRAMLENINDIIGSYPPKYYLEQYKEAPVHVSNYVINGTTLDLRVYISKIDLDRDLTAWQYLFSDCTFRDNGTLWHVGCKWWISNYKRHETSLSS